MPTFEVVVTRKVTEMAEVEIEAATAEDAERIVETALTDWRDQSEVLADLDWNRSDCQDDGSIWSVTLKPPVATEVGSA
jgi:hypothetical protein